MRTLPINIINLICEWASEIDQEWIPFFCQKTHNLSYKVNKYCKKLIEKGDIILHNTLETYMIDLNVYIDNSKTREIFRDASCKCILYQYIDGSFNIYIEVDSERDSNKKDKFIYRAMLKFDGDNFGGTLSFNTQYLYLNGTNYATIYDGWFNNTDKELILFIETF